VLTRNCREKRWGDVPGRSKRPRNVAQVLKVALIDDLRRAKKVRSKLSGGWFILV